MCFSANASFGLGTALLLVGIATVRKSTKRVQIPFAAIPVFFSIQQFIEGFLWLSLTNPSWQSWHHPLTYLFLIFAQVLWPSFIPFSIFLIEENVTRKKALLTLTGFGCVISLYVVYALLNYEIDSHVSGHHVSYDLYFPGDIVKISAIFYFIPTVLPSFVSSVKSMIFLGLTLFISFVVTRLFFVEYAISVWCYFAAAISVIVIIIMVRFHKGPKKPSIVTKMN